jgi:RNA polymerase sigma factor (sigma-70 family)
MVPPQDTETAHWFESEIQPHEAELRRYLRGFVPTDSVDDMVQETYIRLLRARVGRKVRAPRSLLFAIARNAARDVYRREVVAKTKAVAEIDELPVLDEAQDTPELICLRQEISLLHEAIQALPERCRAVLIMRKLHNLSHQEIADCMSISVHTVEAQLTKALRRCEKYLQHRGVHGKGDAS